jgi:sporulation protein YlmC with PRC-barrel domain
MTIHNERLKDRAVIDPKGTKIGKVTDVIFDSSDLEPDWLVVRPGLFKGEHYVPVEGALTEGDQFIVVPYEIETVTSSPKASRDHTMSSVARSVLRDHYHVAKN